ncbi:MAG: DUF5655 domain-containing protein [Candidatus Omnitrophica bacterium]|nr:DUF5655 domain-containing protein [Candidatus Omnitrophota bacterium]
MAIFNVTNDTLKKLTIKRFKNEKELQTLFEKNTETIFGVRLLASEFETTHGGRIDTLGIDEDNAPVIIEYKENEKDNIINQGLFYLDWLIDHKGDFEMLVYNKCGEKIKINWDEPRLILVAQNFNDYDKYAVNRIAENIELWKYTIYENDVLLVERINLPKEDKQKQKVKSKKIVFEEYSYDDHLKGKNSNIKNLVLKLKEQILSLDSHIQEKVKKHYIAFALERNFCEFVVQVNSVRVHLDIEKDRLKDPKNIVEDRSQTGHWATGNSVIKVTNENEIPYLMGLVKQSYENKL